MINSRNLSAKAEQAHCPWEGTPSALSWHDRDSSYLRRLLSQLNDYMYQCTHTPQCRR